LSSLAPTSVRSPIFLILVVYLTMTYLSVMLPESIAGALTRENSFFELLGALCFLITSILFWTAYRRLKPTQSDNAGFKNSFKRLSYLFLALLFFFGAGEEISWGQILFSLQAPEAISEINAQNEFNIHNLNILTEGDHERGALHLITVRRLFNLFWLIFAVLIPIAAYFHLAVSRWLNAFIPVGPIVLAPLFLANWIVWKALWLTDPYYDTAVEVIEISESNFAVLFVFFAIGAIWDGSGRQNEPKTIIASSERPHGGSLSENI